MSKFEVKAGYHEWLICKDGKTICAIEDGDGGLAERVTAEGDGLIPISELSALCMEHAAAAHDENGKVFTIAEQVEVWRELFIAWARHFGYDDGEIGEWSGSAVTNHALVEDGNGKIHAYMKILDERESWTLDAFQHEVQEYAKALGGKILAIYRERDIVEWCRL